MVPSKSILICALVLGACGVPPAPHLAPTKVAWVTAGKGAVPPLVAAERSRALSDGQKALVYVGATWCEPCRRFHEAVRAGVLDGPFAGLRIVEFDLDVDATRLRDAGYEPRLIPMLALPRADGRASGKHIEGSVKGEGAVSEITPRLQALLRSDL